MNFIKKILDKRVDELVHLQFQKFSRGEFRDKAGIVVKKTGGKYTINTSPEFANEMVRIAAEKLGSNKTNITGVIVTTLDLTGQLKFQSKGQFQGVKKYVIGDEMSGSEIISLLNKFPKVFFGLSFAVGETTLKIKPKMPKSGKPSTKEGEGPKIDFCKLVTTDPKIGESFVFEKPDFKKAEVNHTFFIEEIVIPAELKNEKDFAKVREGARRKGKIVRVAKIDDKEIKTEIEFEA